MAVTLHLNAERREFWSVKGAYGAIFAHPTVRELTLSSANLRDDVTERVKTGTRTPLRRLTLDECNVSFGALREILLLPVALEYLFLGMAQLSTP